jgi:hypothetical protein
MSDSIVASRISCVLQPERRSHSASLKDETLAPGVNYVSMVAHASIISYNYKSSEFLTPGTFLKQAPYNILVD